MADSFGYKKGDVLEVVRGLYSHYGVYAGDGKVIHFTADDGSGHSETDPNNADIIETDLSVFQKGGHINVDNQEEAKYSRDEIVSRARALIGTQKGNYDLVTNNCEHFAKYCKTGSKISDQVDEVRTVVPPVVFDTYEELRDTAKITKSVFSVPQEETYRKISRKTQELLSDFNDKPSEMTTDDWVGNTLAKINPALATAEYVKDYLADVNNELDIYDGYKKDLQESRKKGMSVSEWFKSRTQEKAGEILIGIPDLDKNMPNADRAELYLDSVQAQTMDSMAKNLAAEAKKEPSAAVKNFIDGINSENPDSVRVAKIAAATGIKIAGSKVLNFEIPNSIAVPVASAGVDIGLDIRRCTKGEINVLSCVGRCTGHVATAAVHIIKRGPEIVREAASGFITRSISSLATTIAGSTTICSAENVKRVSDMSKGFSTAANTHKSNAISKVGNFAKKAVGAIKSAGKSIAKGIFGGGKKR